jgi:hypothetical protein
LPARAALRGDAAADGDAAAADGAAADGATAASASAARAPPLRAAMALSELQAMLRAEGVSTVGIYERADLEALLRAARARSTDGARRARVDGGSYGGGGADGPVRFEALAPLDAPLLRRFQRICAWTLRRSARDLLARLASLRVPLHSYDPLGAREALALALAAALLAPSGEEARALRRAADDTSWPRDALGGPRALCAEEGALVGAYSEHALAALQEVRATREGDTARL